MADKLMVVAHPDDETIFGGAHLIAQKGWKVICVTNGDDRQRALEFSYAMELVSADYDIWEYRDSYSGKFDSHGLTKDLEREIHAGCYQKIVTHNVRGEYGHKQHQAIARIMRNIVRSNLYVFSFGQKTLPAGLRNLKQEILSTVYESQRRTISQLPLERYIHKERFIRVK